MSIPDQASLAGNLDLASSGFTGRFLRAVLGRMEQGRLVIELPSGERVRWQAPWPGPEAAIILKDWRAVRHFATGGALGFAESFISGDWTSPDLPALIELLARNAHVLQPAASGSWLSRGIARLWHRLNENTRRGSRKNIQFHYDLGNDFYETWLDGSMQYSSAIYDGAADLEGAQRRKLDRIVDLLDLTGGERVLEIGCGWGAVAERLAADHACHVTGLTLSDEQLAYAQRRLRAGGLAERTAIRLQDYRDCDGSFDRVVSIEMIEAVGERYWSPFFELLRNRLVPGGIGVIQAITIHENRFEDYRRRADFIQRHIFPGGMLPTVGIMRREIAAAGLELVSLEGFGESYAATLAEWRRRFHTAWPRIEAMGFDEPFRRSWDYYLSYCEGGFRAGTIDVGLFTVRRQID